MGTGILFIGRQKSSIPIPPFDPTRASIVMKMADTSGKLTLHAAYTGEQHKDLKGMIIQYNVCNLNTIQYPNPEEGRRIIDVPIDGQGKIQFNNDISLLNIPFKSTVCICIYTYNYDKDSAKRSYSKVFYSKTVNFTCDDTLFGFPTPVYFNYRASIPILLSWQFEYPSSFMKGPLTIRTLLWDKPIANILDESIIDPDRDSDLSNGIYRESVYPEGYTGYTGIDNATYYDIPAVGPAYITLQCVRTGLPDIGMLVDKNVYVEKIPY